MHGDTNKPTKLGLKIGLVLKKKKSRDKDGAKAEDMADQWLTGSF